MIMRRIEVIKFVRSYNIGSNMSVNCENKRAILPSSLVRKTLIYRMRYGTSTSGGHARIGAGFMIVLVVSCFKYAASWSEIKRSEVVSSKKKRNFYKKSRVLSSNSHQLSILGNRGFRD